MSLTLPGTGAMVLPSDTTVVTPALFDDSLKVASTAFVKDNGGALAGVFNVSTNTTLTTAHANSLIIVDGSAGIITLTLPSAATYSAGTILKFLNISGFSATVNRVGADVINGSVTTFSVGPGDTLTLVRGTTSTSWSAPDGTMVIGGSTGFKASFASPGYTSLPNGLLLQWGGVASVATTGTAVTFPTAFPNNCLRVFSSCNDAAGNAVTVNNYGYSLTGFTADAGTGGYAQNYFAIGY